MAELIIPKEWQPTKVSDIGILIKGVSYKKHEARNAQENGLKPILRANNINGNLNFEDLVYVPENRIIAQQYIKKHDILFCMSSGSKNLVGKSSQAEKDFEGSYGVFCSLFRPFSIINQRFVGYFFQAPRYRKFVSSISKGTNINNLKREHILDIDFCLPSLQEQNQIVNSLEELFSDLDNAIENLKKAREQIKVYRQAVLKYAFEGRLTHISADFKDVKIGVACECVQTISNAVNPEEQFLYIDIGCIDNRVNRIVTNKKYLWKNAPSRAKQIIKSGDILFSTVRTYLKNVAMVPVQYDGQIGSTGFCVIRPKKEILDSRYIFRYVLWEKFINTISAFQTGTSYPAVRDENIFSQIIPLPDLPIQKIIVEEIESRFSICDKIEESINENLQKAEALRQSILKQAFEGTLTERWRKEHKDLISGENSAQALLKKIKAEKETLWIQNKR